MPAVAEPIQSLLRETIPKNTPLRWGEREREEMGRAVWLGAGLAQFELSEVTGPVNLQALSIKLQSGIRALQFLT